MDTASSFPGVKWPGRDADHSPPSSAEVKDGAAILVLPLRYYGMVSTGKALPVFSVAIKRFP
jgi:hypothetical protein